MLVASPLPPIFILIFPLSSLYGNSALLANSSKFDSTIVCVISVFPDVPFVEVAPAFTVTVGFTVLVTSTPFTYTVMSSASNVLVTSLA